MKLISSLISFLKQSKNKLDNRNVNSHNMSFSYSTCLFLKQISKNFKNLKPQEIISITNSEKYVEWGKENLGRYMISLYEGRLNQLWAIQLQFIKDKLQEQNINKQVTFEQSLNVHILKDIVNSSPVIIGTNASYDGKVLGHIVFIKEYDSKEDRFIIDDPYRDKTIPVQICKSKKEEITYVKTKDLEKILSQFALYINS